MLNFKIAVVVGAMVVLANAKTVVKQAEKTKVPRAALQTASTNLDADTDGLAGGVVGANIAVTDTVGTVGVGGYGNAAAIGVNPVGTEYGTPVGGVSIVRTQIPATYQAFGSGIGGGYSSGFGAYNSLNNGAAYYPGFGSHYNGGYRGRYSQPLSNAYGAPYYGRSIGGFAGQYNVQPYYRPFRGGYNYYRYRPFTNNYYGGYNGYTGGYNNYNGGNNNYNSGFGYNGGYNNYNGGFGYNGGYNSGYNYNGVVSGGYAK